MFKGSSEKFSTSVLPFFLRSLCRSQKHYEKDIVWALQTRAWFAHSALAFARMLALCMSTGAWFSIEP